MRHLITKIREADYLLIVMLIVGGILNYGWIIAPEVNNEWNIVNGAVLIIVLVTAGLLRFLRKVSGKQNPHE